MQNDTNENMTCVKSNNCICCQRLTDCEEVEWIRISLYILYIHRQFFCLMLEQACAQAQLFMSVRQNIFGNRNNWSDVLRDKTILSNIIISKDNWYMDEQCRGEVRDKDREREKAKEMSILWSILSPSRLDQSIVSFESNSILKRSIGLKSCIDWLIVSALCRPSACQQVDGTLSVTQCLKDILMEKNSTLSSMSSKWYLLGLAFLLEKQIHIWQIQRADNRNYCH